jgi:hypothetical protein
LAEAATRCYLIEQFRKVVVVGADTVIGFPLMCILFYVLGDIIIGHYSNGSEAINYFHVSLTDDHISILLNKQICKLRYF